jgi:hypothetical protein
VGQEADLVSSSGIRWLRSGKLSFGLADEVAVAPGRVVRPRQVPESSLHESGIADDFAGSGQFR